MIVQTEHFRQDDGTYILDSGDIVTPDEFEFYDDLSGYSEEEFYDQWQGSTLDAEVVIDRKIEVMPSGWAEFAIKIPVEGIPVDYSFKGREYLRSPYDIHTPRLLLKCGRQVEKSTLLGNSILSRMAITPYFRALYVSPTHEQTKNFRRDRIGEPIALSAILQAYLSSKFANNMSIIKFVNFAQLTLRYAYLSADRVRGIPADGIYIDEIQDILTDNLPVIEECAAHANPLLKMFVYSGTPKSFENTIEYLWQHLSTQNEYALPCDCVKIFDMSPGRSSDRTANYFWNVPLGEEHIGLEHLVCARCGKELSVYSEGAQWVSLNPAIREHAQIDPFEGFRIPQLMVPWIEWSDILHKMATYPRYRFFNEVLALSYDSGNKPLSAEVLMRNCNPKLIVGRNLIDIRDDLRGKPIFFGIDWGTGEKAFTVLVMGAYLNGYSGPRSRFTFFNWKRYTGPDVDPERQVNDILQLIALFQPIMVGADYGGGFDRNNKLMHHLGPQRLAKYQYIGGHQATRRRKIQFDGQKGRYMVDRTEVMSDLFNAVKDDKFEFPVWREFAEPFAADMLNIFAEYNEMTRMIQYDKAPNLTDDSFHAMLYCFLASYLRYPRPDILRPTQESVR